jgi:hypothetical protein
MAVDLHARLALAVVACLVSCSSAPDPALSAIRQAVGARLGSAAVVNVGFLRDSTGLLIDFRMSALPDTQDATFARIAREVATVAVSHYAKRATLEVVMVSAGEVLARGVFRAEHQRTFTAADLR